LSETKKRSHKELDVIFAAGGNPVKKEKSVEHNLTVEESRRASASTSALARWTLWSTMAAVQST